MKMSKEMSEKLKEQEKKEARR